MLRAQVVAFFFYILFVSLFALSLRCELGLESAEEGELGKDIELFSCDANNTGSNNDNRKQQRLLPVPSTFRATFWEPHGDMHSAH